MVTKQILNHLRLDSRSSTKVETFEKLIDFFSVAAEYIEKWSQSFQTFNAFDWMTLKHVPEMEEIKCAIAYL